MSATPTYQMFDIIAQSAVGNLGNAGLIMLQLMVSLFFEVRFLFSSMRKRPPLVQFSVAMIPLILIATYSIACGIIFSAFLGNGPTVEEMTALVNVTLTERCVYEMLLVSAVLFVLMLIYSVAYRLTPFQWLMTFGIEMLAALSLLALYGGLLLPDFPFTILDLWDIDIHLARWPIYGYFTLLFKCCVLVTCLVLGFFLRERKEKPETDEEIYSDRQGYYERKTLRYLTKNDALIGGAFLLFSVAAEIFLYSALRRDSSMVWDVNTTFTMLFSAALFALPGGIGICLFYRTLRPRTCVAYRQLLAMGDKDTVLRLFCREIVDGKAPDTGLWASNDKINTVHFSYWQQGVKPRVVWRGEKLP